MKKYTVMISGIEGTYFVPDNCMHRAILIASKCKAPHKSNPECDCRWCVFNKEYLKASNSIFESNKKILEDTFNDFLLGGSVGYRIDNKTGEVSTMSQKEIDKFLHDHPESEKRDINFEEMISRFIGEII